MYYLCNKPDNSRSSVYWSVAYFKNENVTFSCINLINLLMILQSQIMIWFLGTGKSQYSIYFTKCMFGVKRANLKVQWSAYERISSSKTAHWTYKS